MRSLAGRASGLWLTGMNMKRFSFVRKVITALLGSIILLVALSSAFAGEKHNAGLSDQPGCPAVLLTNEDYFPALIKAIDEAQSEIFIAIFSFKTDMHKNSYPDRILGHLAQAAKRGVKVTVIMEIAGRGDDELSMQNKQTGELLEAKGVKVYFDSPRKTTHTKLIVIDERLVILGSHNWTQSALKHNNEISILLERPDLATRARNYMLTIIQEAK
jgi:phosphatidylserine/phosphatidylglycerophosphate/cardiolipin synthase-like enzyme